MNTFEIENILSKDYYAMKTFRGVYARDELPLHADEGFYIANTHTRNRPGEHWFCLYFLKDGKAEFFDSYGFSPAFYGLQSYMELNSSAYISNKRAIQSLFSKVCGHYAIYYVLRRSRGIAMKHIVSDFSSNVFENDRSILYYIDSLK